MDLMKNNTILLVGSEPEAMPRLKLVYMCLTLSGFNVRVFASFEKGRSKFSKVGSIIRYFSNMTKLFFERADVYHFFNIPDILGLPLLLKRGTLVYDVRSPWKEVVHDTTKNKFLSKIAGIVERLFCMKADVVIAANPLLAERSISFGAKECGVVPNFPYAKAVVEDRVLLLCEDEPIVLYFGKISKVEGSEILGDIIIKTLALRHDIRFFIAGDGPELPRLKSRIEEAGLKDCVEFLGWIPQNHLFSYIKLVDLCIMPREEFGTSKWIHPDSVWKVNEAVSMGTPVLASRVGGFTRDTEFFPLFTQLNEYFVEDMLDLLKTIRSWGKLDFVKRDWRECQKRLDVIYEGIK